MIVSGNDDGLFQINQEGIISLSDSKTLDYDSKKEHRMQVCILFIYYVYIITTMLMQLLWCGHSKKKHFKFAVSLTLLKKINSNTKKTKNVIGFKSCSIGY